MGSASSTLTQYDIEEVQEHSSHLFSQQEIVSLYKRFCQLDRNSKGYISSDEFLSVPEFSMNPLSQRLLNMVDGLNFKDFVAFLSTFSTKASMPQKVQCSFMSDEQREEVLSKVLQEAGYTRDSTLLLDDFVKIFGKLGPKMEVEVPVD